MHPERIDPQLGQADRWRCRAPCANRIYPDLRTSPCQGRRHLHGRCRCGGTSLPIQGFDPCTVRRDRHGQGHIIVVAGRAHSNHSAFVAFLSLIAQSRLTKRNFPGKAAPRRGVAQSGSAPALGAGCRRFESCLPDHSSLSTDLACPSSARLCGACDSRTVEGHIIQIHSLDTVAVARATWLLFHAR